MKCQWKSSPYEIWHNSSGDMQELTMRTPEKATRAARPDWRRATQLFSGISSRDPQTIILSANYFISYLFDQQIILSANYLSANYFICKLFVHFKRIEEPLSKWMLQTRFFAKKKMFRLWNPFFLNQSERIFIAILAREKNRFYEIRHSHELDTAGVFLQPNKQDIRLENTQVLIDGLHPSVTLFWSFIKLYRLQGKISNISNINKTDVGGFTATYFRT